MQSLIIFCIKVNFRSIHSSYTESVFFVTHDALDSVQKNHCKPIYNIDLNLEKNGILDLYDPFPNDKF